MLRPRGGCCPGLVVQQELGCLAPAGVGRALLRSWEEVQSSTGLTVPALGVQGCPRGREAPSLLGTAGKHSSRVLSSPRGCACPVTVTAAVVALPAERCCRGGCTRAGLPFTSPAAKQVHSDNRVKIGIKKWNVKQQLSWLSCSAC